MHANRSASVRRRTFLKRAGLAALMALGASAALASGADPQGAAKSATTPAATGGGGPATVLAANGGHHPVLVSPVRVVRAPGTRLGLRAPIDARIINITFINRSRNPPDTYAATTRQAIDAWTNTVFYGAASGLGTPVDQWVAMVYWLDR
jgi:hypothetical protein